MFTPHLKSKRKKKKIKTNKEKKKKKKDFKEKEKENNYFILVDIELVKNYNKNLEELKRNLLINKYSIPVSNKTNTSS